MSERILSNLNIQFLLSVKEILRFATVIIIERCEFFLGSFKFPSFVFPKLIPRVIKALKPLDEMPYMDYMSFIRTPDGFEWKRFQDQLRPFLIEDGGLYNIHSGENWDL